MKIPFRIGILVGLFAETMGSCGCGEKPSANCTLSVVISVSPTSAVANHTAAPPGNQVQFVAMAAPTAPAGCAVPLWIARVYGTWSNPDPAAITISSASDATNGIAICKAATNGAVPLTGTFTQLAPAPVTEVAQFTCN